MKTDIEIQKDVMDELKWEPSITAPEIGVAVKNGIVTLSGTVDSYLKKLAAEAAAKRVAGVKAVAEDIEIKLTGTLKRNDTEIAQTVLNTLRWNSAVDETKIQAKVEDGWVTLEGEVEWEYQKEQARKVVENLNGVRGITIMLKITPKVALKDVKQKIHAALHRSATVDANRVNIEVAGNKVVLTGRVRSMAEKKDAEDAAWAAPGVTLVENKIDVGFAESLAY